MKNKNKITVLLILCCVFMISGCKPQKDIVGEIMPVTAEYKKQPIMEYFQKKDKFVNVSSSVGIRNEDESLTIKGMTLKYYPNDKKAYGVYSVDQYFNQGKRIESSEIPLMLDENGYQVKNGYELIEEIRNFIFMSEEVAFTPEYIKSLKVENTDYTFEVPSYSVTYLFLNTNDEIKEYLKKKDLLQYGEGYSVVFGKKGRGYGGGDMTLNVNNEKELYISETFNQNISEEGTDYKGQYLGEEMTTNE
ncbi:Csa1 family protein [Isobaculum melis]|uniref:Lipoprotein n=1 Tax=Isobaculum melis TaxID=142588 RepID=A0A1H9PVX8_9LACT|nr:Csa1 family protein [Isobaculum melis]SER51929.1 Protein of unknown function, DUF576 [Isobaculum melis]